MKDGQYFEAHRVVLVNSRLPFVLNIWNETHSHSHSLEPRQACRSYRKDKHIGLENIMQITLAIVANSQSYVSATSLAEQSQVECHRR